MDLSDAKGSDKGDVYRRRKEEHNEERHRDTTTVKEKSLACRRKVTEPDLDWRKSKVTRRFLDIYQVQEKRTNRRLDWEPPSTWEVTRRIESRRKVDTQCLLLFVFLMEVGIFDILLLFSSLAISLAVVVPLAGVLVRFRANYNPKSLQLDPEDGPQPHTGPIINSYFGMFKRVYQLERLSGLYKGFMPTFLSTTAVTLVLLLAMDDPKPRHGRYSAPDTGVFGTLFYGILMSLIGLPTVILTYRSTTTPHKLPWLNLVQSLRVLLTPTERQRPWMLYLTPGLLAAEFAHVGYVTLVLGTLRRLLLPALSKPGIPTPSDFPPLRTIIYISVVVVSTIILTPLEVISTRLAIQRNHALSEHNSVSQEVDGDAEDLPEYSPEEDVIGLRNEEDPYIGIVDCAQRILQEEGFGALYRAWWITMLGGLAAAFT